MKIDFSIFAKLWKSADTNIRPMSSGKDLLYIPHTIVFMDGVPFGWYFTSHIDGRYKRRSKKKLVTEEIYDHFTKLSRKRARARQKSGGISGGSRRADSNNRNRNSTGSKSPRKPKNNSPTQRYDEDLDQDLLASERVVAVWIQAVQAVGKRSATIESTYMNLEELKYFLFSQAKGVGAGILQQVIHMHGNTRRALICHWSPHISTVEMHVNKKTVTNAKIHINVRMADVNAGRGNTEITRLDLSTKLGSRIKVLSDSIAARIEEIANTSRDGRLMIDPSKMNHQKTSPRKKTSVTTPTTKKKVKGSSKIDAEIAAMARLAGYETPASSTLHKQDSRPPPQPQPQQQPQQPESNGIYRDQLQKNYLDPYLRNATFQEKRNLLGVRLHSASFNFLIGEDNKTYLAFCNDVIIDHQPAYQKRKKKSNAHTLEIETLETATRNQQTLFQNSYVPMPSPILEKMGLGLLPTPEVNFYRTYKDSNYEPEPDPNDTERDGLAGTGFSVREMLKDDAEMLRAFFRRYAHHQTGALNLREVFSNLDTSGDGQISSVEFRDLFREVNIHLTRTQLFAVIRLFDEDCDGRVSIDEFENWIVTDPVKRTDNMALAIARENKISPWSHGTTESARKKYKDQARVAVDSVLFRRMRAVDGKTATVILNEEHAQAAAMIEARAKALADSFASAGATVPKTEEEKRDEMLKTVPGEGLGSGLAKQGESLPASIERAYGKYRAHYMETVSIPLRGYKNENNKTGSNIKKSVPPGRLNRRRHPKESPVVASRTVKPAPFSRSNLNNSGSETNAKEAGGGSSEGKSWDQNKIYGAKLLIRPLHL